LEEEEEGGLSITSYPAEKRAGSFEFFSSLGEEGYFREGRQELVMKGVMGHFTRGRGGAYCNFDRRGARLLFLLHVRELCS